MTSDPEFDYFYSFYLEHILCFHPTDFVCSAHCKKWNTEGEMKNKPLLLSIFIIKVFFFKKIRNVLGEKNKLDVP